VPDLSERLRNAGNATKRAPFDAFDLRVVYDKMGRPALPSPGRSPPCSAAA
jgi:hypothetical protein